MHWIDDSGTADADLLAQARVGYRAYFDALSAKAPSPEAVFGAFAQFRVLCAVHDGRRGVDSINEALRDSLCQMRGSVRADGSDWFFGRPVMVLQNDHALRLFNGDIGILLPGPSGQPMVVFEQPAGGFRMIPPVRLPAVQTAFALTVHKAQGSEFDAVMLLLPQQPHRVVSRELLYTAVTRARQRVVIVGAEPVVRAAIGARTERQSGLLQRLRETS
ncbi:MAG: ATP-binding domain-containing protein [Quisquiliibacterium sp.]